MRKKLLFIPIFRIIPNIGICHLDYIQRQPHRGFPRKRCSKKYSKFTGEHPCRYRTSAWLSPVNCCIFSEHFFLRTPLDGCFCIDFKSNLTDIASKRYFKYQNHIHMLNNQMSRKHHCTFRISKQIQPVTMKTKITLNQRNIERLTGCESYALVTVLSRG